MPEITKFNADVLGWQRKEGPLNVWAVVDGRKKMENGEIPKFSIQEIPEDRYEDAVKLITVILMQDEPLCANVGLFDDPNAHNDFQKMWSFCLQQGATVGAFLVEPNNPKPTLVGVNMTWIACEASKEGMSREIPFTSQRMKKVADFMADMEKEANPRELYKVDKYISAFGLAVDRPYRGQGLANHILKARDMMAKFYDIKATSTVFSGVGAQKAAANAGFDTLIERIYTECRDEEGKELFPGVPQKICKLMGKRFS